MGDDRATCSLVRVQQLRSLDVLAVYFCSNQVSVKLPRWLSLAVMQDEIRPAKLPPPMKEQGKSVDLEQRAYISHQVRTVTVRIHESTTVAVVSLNSKSRDHVADLQGLPPTLA